MEGVGSETSAGCADGLRHGHKTHFGWPLTWQFFILAVLDRRQSAMRLPVGSRPCGTELTAHGLVTGLVPNPHKPGAVTCRSLDGEDAVAGSANQPCVPCDMPPAKPAIATTPTGHVCS